MCLIKLVKGANIGKNCFSPQIESHTACFFVVLEHFGGNSQKPLFSQKIDNLRKKLGNT